MEKEFSDEKNSQESDWGGTLRIMFLMVLVTIVVCMGILYKNGAFVPGNRKVDIETGKVHMETTSYSDSSLEENMSISVPGYEKLEFTAGKKMQRVYLYNPKGNTCYFKLNLTLEDGTVIWQSDLLEPGMAFNRIQLEQTLEKGIYENVTLNYECYSLVDQRKLNGSAIKLYLEVKE